VFMCCCESCCCERNAVARKKCSCALKGLDGGPVDTEAISWFSPIVGIGGGIVIGICFGLATNAGAGVTATFLWGTSLAIGVGLCAGFCQWCVLIRKCGEEESNEGAEAEANSPPAKSEPY